MRKLSNRQLAFVLDFGKPSSSAPMLAQWFGSNVSGWPVDILRMISHPDGPV
jgi:hypothetical protein